MKCDIIDNQADSMREGALKFSKTKNYGKYMVVKNKFNVVFL